MTKLFDENEIRKTIHILKPDNQLFEVRIIYENTKTLSGYFCSAETLIQALNSISVRNKPNIYISLQYLNDACYSRSQRDSFIEKPKNSTSDNDVIGYDWLMIDLDPKRPTGTSSSNEELLLARKLGNKIYLFLRNLGFEKPVTALSGNGVHLLYKIKIRADKDNAKLIEKCLKTLNMLFTTNEVEVDVKNFNPARICKLYGTVSNKGSNTKDRPHRLSMITGCPENIKTTDIKYLQKLCEYYPKEEKPQRYNNYNPKSFDMEEWLNKYSINYKKDTFSDGDKFILEHCPFDHNHNGKDACIFVNRNGAIGFNCFHNSCSDKTWKDVRMMFEPDAYEKKNMEYRNRMYSAPTEPPKIKPLENQPIFYTADDIENLPRQEEVFIETGIKEIDKKIRGLKLGAVSVFSGLRASAKSTLLSQIALNAIDKNINVCIYSGELTPRNFMKWLYLQAAGKGYTEPTEFEGYYKTPKKYKDQIVKWLADKLLLYNNDYGNKFEAIKNEVRKVTVEKNVKLIILDNLMSFDIKSLSSDKYQAQTDFIWELQRIAKDLNVHIAFVAHPRKAMGFLRLDDISGTADLGNAVDYAFIVHRVNNDFRRLSKQMFMWKDDNPIYKATNAIEIAKDRDGGTQDYFVPLWYETETKRLKNDETENKIFSWNNEVAVEGFVPVGTYEETPFD